MNLNSGFVPLIQTSINIIMNPTKTSTFYNLDPLTRTIYSYILILILFPVNDIPICVEDG